MGTEDRRQPCVSGQANQQRAVDHYDVLSPGYDSRRSTWLTRRDNNVIRDLLQPSVGERALDAACGTGVQARCLARRGLRVCAVDLSARMIDLVRPHVDEAHVADIAELDLEARFDCIVCNGALEFVPSPARCLEVLARHLRDGGRLVVIAPRLSLCGLYYHLRHRLWNGIHTHLFHRRSFVEVARRCGLRQLGVCHPFLHTIAFGWIKQSETQAGSPLPPL
jgi:ubiquinone/menaquinone biosynthesis C-methylase UbiE